VFEVMFVLSDGRGWCDERVCRCWLNFLSWVSELEWLMWMG